MMHGKNRLIAEVQEAMYVLEAMNGPLDGKRWEFDASIVIGRDSAASQAAIPMDRAVSRRHAQIESKQACLSIVDLGSSNGTIVRGEAIADLAALSLHEPFVVGRTMLRVLPAPAVSRPAEKGGR